MCGGRYDSQQVLLDLIALFVLGEFWRQPGVVHGVVKPGVKAHTPGTKVGRLHTHVSSI